MNTEQFKQFVSENKDNSGLFNLVLKHRGANGTTREFAVYVVKDGKLKDVTFAASEVTERKIGKNGGIRVLGCGQDMAFYLTCDILGSVLNDHSGVHQYNAAQHYALL